VTAKNLKGNFLRAATFEFSGMLSLKVLLLCEGSVFLRTLLSFHLSCVTVSLSLFGAPLMAIKSKHEYLFSLLTEEQKEALERVQDALEEDPLYLEHHRKEEKDNA